MKMSDRGDKVLVCLTPQSNGKRLIDRGLEIARANAGELHILHVEKGGSVFVNQDTPKLLQELFNYGSSQGGVVHGLCGKDVVKVISRFISREGVTHVVLGEPPEIVDNKTNHFFEKLVAAIKKAEITVVVREKK